MLRNENFMEYGTFRVKTPDKQISQIIFGEFELKPYFCSNKSHHASQRCVPRWDFAFYMVYELRQTTDKYRWTISLASKQRTDNWRYCNSQTTTSQYQLFSGCQLSQIHRARPTASSLQAGQYIRTSHQPLSLWQRTPPTHIQGNSRYRDFSPNKNDSSVLNGTWRILVYGFIVIQECRVLWRLPWQYQERDISLKWRFHKGTFREIYISVSPSCMENLGGSIFWYAFQVILLV